MLDMSWGEMMVIGAVALIVIGPKDLPKALRTVGQMTSKVRRMAAEFQGQFNEAMREAELDDVKRQIQGINDSVGSMNRSFNPAETIRDELKGAIEPPAGAESNATDAVAGSEAASRGETSLPATPEIGLPPPAPQRPDPADTVAAEVQRSTEDRHKRAEMPGETS